MINGEVEKQNMGAPKVNEDLEFQIRNEIEREYPHSPRIVYEPNLVEIFYKLIKKEKLMALNDVRCLLT